MINVKALKTIQPETGVLGGCLSEDGTTAYVACLNGDVLACDIKSGESTKLGKHGSYASGAKLLPQRKLLVTAGYDGRIHWYDLDKNEQLRSVEAHSFWSWDMAVSPDEKWVASVSGQYLAGGYKYEPASAEEPSVKVFAAESGELKWSFHLTPSVQAVAISPNSRFVAAANLMGEVRVWDLQDGKLVGEIKTDDFTSWGIIKSHCYIGGIFALHFAPDSGSVYAAGMGPMRDPMAGNGRQRWHCYRLPGQTPSPSPDDSPTATNPADVGGETTNEKPRVLQKTKQSDDKQCGEGLMEALAFHPQGEHFVMGGRLRGGEWNAAFFARDTGARIHHLNSKFRITTASYSKGGERLLLGGTVRQPKPNDSKKANFGRLAIYEIS